MKYFFVLKQIKIKKIYSLFINLSNNITILLLIGQIDSIEKISGNTQFMLQAKSLNQQGIWGKINQANSYLQEGNIGKAQQIYTSCLQNNPYLYTGLFRGMANLQYRFDFQGQTIEEYTKFKEIPKQTSIYDLFSLCFNYSKQLNEGISWYKKMIQKYPRIYQLHFGIANIYHKQRNIAKAQFYYRQVLYLNPYLEKARQTLAFIYYFDYRNISLAQDMAERCLKINKQNIYSQFIVALCQTNLLDKIAFLARVYKEQTYQGSSLYLVGKDYRKEIKKGKRAIFSFQPRPTNQQMIEQLQEEVHSHKSDELGKFHTQQTFSSVLELPSLEEQNILVNKDSDELKRDLVKLRQKGDQFFLKGQVDEAITIYRKCLEEKLDFDETKFRGQGNIVQIQGHEKLYVLEWYKSWCRITNQKMSVFDCLALCFMVNQKYEEGRSSYKEMLEKNPNSFQLTFGLANMHFNKIFYKEPEKAEKIYLKVIDLNPLFPKAYQNIAFIYIWNYKNFKQALEWIQRYRLCCRQISQKQDCYVSFIFACAYGNMTKQIQALIKQSQKWPRYAIMYLQIGALYSSLQKSDKQNRIGFFYKAIQILPGYSRTHYLLGNLYENINKEEMAIKCYEQCLQLDQKFLICRLKLASTLRKIGNTKNAIIILQAGIQIQPKNILYFELANCYEQLRQTEKQIQCYEKFLQIDPKSEQAYYNIAIIYLNKGQYKKAINFLQDCIKVNEKYAQAYSLTIRAYYHLLQYNQAVETYQRAVSIDLSQQLDINSYQYLGNIFYKKKDYAQAINFSMKLIEYDPKKPLYHKRIAQMYIQIDFFEEAQQFIRTAQGYLQDDQKLHYEQKRQIIDFINNFRGIGANWAEKAKNGVRPLAYKTKSKVMKIIFKNSLMELFKQGDNLEENQTGISEDHFSHDD